MKKNNIGVFGLAVMGSNLALNIADHGYDVSIFKQTTSVDSLLKFESELKKFTQLRIFKWRY